MKLTKRKDGYWLLETKWVMVGAENRFKLLWEYLTFMLHRPPALVKRSKKKKKGSPTK